MQFCLKANAINLSACLVLFLWGLLSVIHNQFQTVQNSSVHDRGLINRFFILNDQNIENLLSSSLRKKIQ